MRTAMSMIYVAAMAVGFWGSGMVESRLSALLPLGVLASGFVAYRVPWVAPLLPPVALALAVTVGNAIEAFDNEYAWMNYAGALLLSELFIAVGIVLRRREAT